MGITKVKIIKMKKQDDENTKMSTANVDLYIKFQCDMRPHRISGRS